MNFTSRSRSRLTFVRPLFFAGTAASLMVFAAVGCGSGGGSAPVGGGSILSSAPVVGYLGRLYSSQVALANGQVGTLTLTVAGNNTASGSLQIDDPSRGVKPAKSRFVIATPSLSGTFDPATGAINLTGSYTLNGQTIPISIVGTLPTPPSLVGGSLTVTIDGQSYSSTFGGTGGGTTNPTSSPSPSASASPLPNPSATPNPTPSATPTPAPGAVNTVTLTAEPGTGPNNSVGSVVGVSVTATLKEFSSASPFSRIAINFEDGSQHIVNVAVITAAPLAPGTHPIKIDASSFTAPGAGLSYREGFDFSTYWQAGGINFDQVDGTIIVDQVDANKVRVQLINVLMDARPITSAKSKGSLRANGIIETTLPSTFVTQ